MTKKVVATKALYIDTLNEGSHHEMFNSSLIMMCSIVFDVVECKLDKSVYKAISNIVNNDFPQNTYFKYITVIKGNSRFRSILRYLFSALQNVRYLVLAPNDVVLVYSSNNLLGIRFLNFFNKIYKKKILIFCHGDMEGLVTSPKKGGYLHRLLTWLSHDFFLNPNVKIADNIHFSVMGDVLKNNISELVSNDKVLKFIRIDHPYIFKKIEIKEPIKEDDLLSIGTVGVLSKNKGMDSFIEFVSKSNVLQKGKIKTSIIGKIDGDSSLIANLGIATSFNNQIISRNILEESINKLDFILFFYPKESYKITASGAIMDAISARKPILALKNDYFEYIFDKYGEFGYLFDEIDQMINKLNELISNRQIVDFDFEKIQLSFTPEALSLQLQDELVRIGYLNT